MMNALTWNFIVLLLLVCRLVRLGGRGFVFLRDQWLVAAEPESRAALLRAARRRWDRTECDGGRVAEAGLCRPQQNRRPLEDQLLNWFAIDHPLDLPVVTESPRWLWQVASLK